MRLIYASMMLMVVSALEFQVAVQNWQANSENRVISRGNEVADLIDNDIELASLVNA